MDSKIASAIHLELEPVVLIWAGEKPEGAMEFIPGKWGCVKFFSSGNAGSEPGQSIGQPRSYRHLKRGKEAAMQICQELLAVEALHR